jgi:uncharacterized paraquat-inducible protein A
MKKNRAKLRNCPRCQTPLVPYRDRAVCGRCLLIWRGDTFEPISREALGLAALSDYFYQGGA